MLTKLIGRIVGLLLSVLLGGLELVMHLFIGIQVLLKTNSITIIQNYLNNLAGYLNSSFFNEYYPLLMKPVLRIAFYALVVFVIILIFVFNKWFSLSLKEVGLVTFVAAIPFLLLSFGWISFKGMIPEAAIEQYEKFFYSAFRNTSLMAIVAGIVLYFIGFIIREIERKIRDKKKREIKEQKLVEKQMKQEERKTQIKNLFGKGEEEPEEEPVPEKKPEPVIEEPLEVIEPVVEEPAEADKPKEKSSFFSNILKFKYGKDPDEDEESEEK
ncbi:MAG: hypothetical protein IJM15_05440 [Erysipelotrichaceae bacterium]|nr:hypothetical protein [Erysipelotrichaceae bacterium]